MKISVVSRYIVREVTTVWLAVVVVLFVVLLTNRFVRFLGDAAEGEIPGGLIMELLGYNAISQLGMMIPASFFLASILALSRFHRDSEMAALNACGVGPGGLYRALYLVAVPLCLLVGAVTLYAAPWAENAKDELMAEAERMMLVQGIQAGRFFQPKAVEGTIYVERISEDRQFMEGVFLKTVREGDTVLLYAERARQSRDPETGERFLVLYDGERYEGVPGAGNWRRLEFAEHGIRVGEPPQIKADSHRAALDTRVLWGSGRADFRAELQYRLSMPLMMLVLTVIAVPLAGGGPREARFARVFAAVLIYMFYSNGLAAAEEWVRQERTPVWLGVWWVHALALGLGGAYLLRQSGWHLGRRRLAAS